mmetsp:Transcript_139656/g.267748  ORF Transcript_139656/g.267748 Transcript_139656/m.267748 type:complete len:186 (+) Transcript_139656:72-629(+)
MLTVMFSLMALSCDCQSAVDAGDHRMQQNLKEAVEEIVFREHCNEWLEGYEACGSPLDSLKIRRHKSFPMIMVETPRAPKSVTRSSEHEMPSFGDSLAHDDFGDWRLVQEKDACTLQQFQRSCPSSCPSSRSSSGGQNRTSRGVCPAGPRSHSRRSKIKKPKGDNGCGGETSREFFMVGRGRYRV